MRKIQIKGKVAACFGVAIGLLMASSWTSCKNTKQNDETDTIAAQKPLGPDFNADSAYNFCAAQCAFGARVMNSKAHDLCEQWIIDKFRSFGCIVSTQTTTVNGYDGTPLYQHHGTVPSRGQPPHPPLCPLGQSAVGRQRPR